ncbi:aspartate aminotransferase family protein [Myxococcota bacterium]|nr:aspartate aminotransferase family protein [Myxococcota bacterium]
MNADEVRRKHREFLFPATMNYYAEPLVVDHARGCTVTDADGRDYLDFFGGILTVSLAHGEERVNRAVRVQLERLSHISSLYPTAPVVELAEMLAARAPGGMTQSFFVASGTEADETAVMLAMRHTGQSELVALRNGYSGRSMLAQSLTAHGPWRILPQQVPGVKHAHAPYCYRCDFGLRPETCGLACARDIEALIKTTTTGRIAGFLAEPVQGVGGFVVPPEGYFEVAVEIVRKYGGLFICDEVQTGFGRTGEHLWGHQHWGAVPDVMTMAKGIANGLPMGNCMTRPEIAESLKGLTISTFGGNPVSSAAAKATLEVIDAEEVPARSARLGARLRAGLDALRARFPRNVGDVRGLGLMQAIELVADETAGDRTPEAALTGRIFEAARERGLLLGKGGLLGNVFRIAPPMLVTEAEIDEGVRLLGEALAAAGAR